MNIKTQNEFQQLVRRILGEEAEEFIQSNIENYELREAERTLLSVGIDQTSSSNRQLKILG